jgi:hypothetical protein
VWLVGVEDAGGKAAVEEQGELSGELAGVGGAAASLSRVG